MVKLYHTTRNQKGKNIYNYSYYVKIGLQQIDQDSRTHHETKTRLSEEIFTSSKLGTQSRDSIPGFRDPGIPGLAFFNPEIPGLEKRSGIAISRWNVLRSLTD